MLKKLPVVVHIDERLIQNSDLLRDLKIDKNRLGHELRTQPGKYAWWATLYSEASARASYLRDKLDRLEAKLSVKYKKEHRRATEVKHLVRLNEDYIELQDRKRRWENAERILKYAEHAFAQRHDVLRSYNTNVRKEREVAEED